MALLPHAAQKQATIMLLPVRCSPLQSANEVLPRAGVVKPRGHTVHVRLAALAGR